MTRHEDLDRVLATWMAADADAPAPAGRLEQAVAATAQRRPRPALLAAFGSSWVGPEAPRDLGYGIRSRWAPILVAALLIIALATVALTVGAGVVRPPFLRVDWPAGMLAYATQDGDVFISDPDGTDPVLISDGQFYSGWSPRWSSDGRFLLYSTDATYVVDPDGTIVLTTEGCCAAWSPDGNLVASAVYREDLDALTVVVTGIDGVIRTQLELHGHPNFLGSATKIYWTPDGRGVTLTGVEWPEGNCCEGLGAVIPIDGSAHYQLPVLPSAQASTVFSNGGSLLVGHGTRQMQGFSASLITTEPDTRQFLVAAVDRAASRPLVPEGRVVEGPWYPHVWSPDDRRVVASHDGGDGNLEQLFAIDVATGQLTLLAATPITQSEYIPLRASDWEAASDRIMFERGDDLWVVSSDGSDARPLVKGAYGGSWQPTP